MRRAAWVLSLVFAGCPATGSGGKPAAEVSRQATTSDPTAEDFVPAPLPGARAVLTDAFAGKHVVDLEVAAVPAARQRGLMWRTALAEGTGMLFIFPVEDELSFWMRNTLIPLDMIFIGKDRSITGIVERAEPKTQSARRVEGRSLYVLEVPGGWCEKLGVKAGSTVDLQGLGAVEVLP